MKIQGRSGKLGTGHVGHGNMIIDDLLDNNKPKKELGYDLMDDLIFFMNNDPAFYRKKYFPSMLKFNQYCGEGKNVAPRGFEPLVKYAYECYQNKFPVEGLEPELDKELCEKICNEIHKRETKNCEDGVYDLED